MKTNFLLVFLGAALVSFGCSNNDGGSDGGIDVANDGPSSTDAASDSGATDSASTDATPDQSSSDGGVAIDVTCTDPTGCEGGTPVCCGTIVLAGGTAPACAVSSISTTCKAAGQCATLLPFDCNGTDTVRFCGQASDCTENNYDKCCTFQTGNQSTTFCANAGIAATVDASCL